MASLASVRIQPGWYVDAQQGFAAASHGVQPLHHQRRARPCAVKRCTDAQQGVHAKIKVDRHLLSHRHTGCQRAIA